MNLAFTKSSLSTVTLLRNFTVTIIALGGLALFVFFASNLIISYPISATVRGYFYGVENLENADSLIPAINEATKNDPHLHSSINADNNIAPSDSSSEITTTPSLKLPSESNLRPPSSPHSEVSISQSSPQSNLQPPSKLRFVVSTNSSSPESNPQPPSSLHLEFPASSSSPISNPPPPSNLHLEFPASSSSPISNPPPPSNPHLEVSTNSSGPSLEQEGKEVVDQPSTPSSSQASDVTGEDSSAVATPLNNATEASQTDSDCDLYHGSWIYDPLGPLYTNNSCPVMTQMQNCQGNGRPDKDYENWRWKPYQCDLPRFDARKFLEIMRGKTLAFIGDSVARNQMESMLCMLWQEEVPKNRGNRRMHRFYFRSTSTMIVRIWSSWLVRVSNEPFDFAPEGIGKLFLDAPDESIMEFLLGFDVVVLSSGHWFAKKSVYILNNEIVGGQLWWPDASRPKKVNSVQAFELSVETILTALATHPNFTGLTILRSFSPDHYEGGAWNTGGSCTGKKRPLAVGTLVENGFTNTMHERQVKGYERAIKRKTNKSKLRMMDITEMFSYRHDGHPGPYRNPDPNKVTERGPDGRPPPQDCLHWCMPGPVDTWNEMLLEVIRREFEGHLSKLP